MAQTKSVLILGAGRVAPPAVRYLARHGLQLSIAANNAPDAQAMLTRSSPSHGRVIAWQADDEATLRRCIADSDVVLSLLPASLHPKVGQVCIDAGRHLVTTSYVSAEMQRLDTRARQAGVLLLNEMGLDPGVDHMSAMQTIDELRATGARITAFRSYCGGLPAPEANDNPWGYKLSWSPVGVLRATQAPARFREMGKDIQLTSHQVFDGPQTLEIEPLGRLEAYPNRDALPYIDRYGLQGIQTMYRGTLRYRGWCETITALKRLGLTSDDKPTATTWSAQLEQRVTRSTGTTLERRVAQHLGLAAEHPVLTRLAWLGLLSDQTLPPGAQTLVEALAALMQQKMAFAPGQRDVIVMRHDIEAVDATSGAATTTHEHHASLVVFGEADGDTAMAKTVGLPAAIAARLVLEGELQQRGVQIPVHATIYRRVLAELETLGIRFK